MKKRNLFTLGLLGASILLMTSCSDDDDEPAPLGPTLSVTETTNGVNPGDLTITEGEPLIFAWDARRGDNDLKTFRVSTSGVNSVSPIPNSYKGKTFPYTVENTNKEIYVDTLGFNNAGNNIGMTSYTFSIEDKLGTTRSVTFDVTVEASESNTPLTDPQNFTWYRAGGGVGTGLSQFGLKWTSNSTTSAIIAINEGTKMVTLTNNDWVIIATQEELGIAVDNGTEITQYTGVSVQQSGTYSDVLGVDYNGTYYILKIEQSTVTTSDSGTNVTILGEYKK